MRETIIVSNRGQLTRGILVQTVAESLATL